MSSETERITNQVLSRHPWDQLEAHLAKAYFEDEKFCCSTPDAPQITRGPSKKKKQLAKHPD
jgi:hypothetical protein